MTAPVMSAAVDPLALVVAGLDALCRRHHVDPSRVENFRVWAVTSSNSGPLALGDIQAAARFDLPTVAS